MRETDVWLRLTRTAGLLLAVAMAAESILSLLGFLPDLGSAAKITMVIGGAGAGVAYAMHVLAGIWSR
jgi:hypothetical protein